MISDAQASLSIEELPDSAPLLGDPERLRERWRLDGVLYLRDVIDHRAVATVREQYLARLKDLGVVDGDEIEPRWNGKGRVDGGLARPVPDEVWRSLVSDPSFDSVVRAFLGEAPSWVPIVVHRTAPPAPSGTKSAPFAGRHQDGIYNYGIDFITCWVPLMDIGDEVGGLAVAPGTHKGSLYPRNVFSNPNQRVGIPEGAIPAADWRRPNYRAGDLLMFHSMTAHAGLPNRSDKFRLSMDVRFLPKGEAKPLVGKMSAAHGDALELVTGSGETAKVIIDEKTVVRGPKGHAVIGDERAGVLFAGAEIIVVPDERGHAKLVRSVSRKYVDLPATWFDTLPANWVK